MSDPPLRLLNTPELPARRNLALTEALLQGGGELLRLQRFPRCALIGAHQNLAAELDLPWCAAHNVEIARRMTGGGAITMEPGILGWELILHRRRLPAGLSEATALLCRAAAAGLATLGVAAEFRPRNDIVVDGRKLGGTGGYFDADRLLFQGTVLIDPDLAFMAQALRLPRGKLSRAQTPSLAQRTTSLARELGRTITADEGAHAIAAGFAEALSRTLSPDEIHDHEWQAATTLHDHHIGTDAFVHGADLHPIATAADAIAMIATPAAVIEATLRHRAGHIVQARLNGDMFITPPRIVADLEATLAGVPLAAAEARARAFLAATGATMLGGDVMQLAQAVAAAVAEAT